MTRKPPTRRVQEDQLQQFETLDNINNFSDGDESLLNTLGNGFTFARHEDHVRFYKVSTNDLSIPEVTTCIRISDRTIPGF